MTKDSRLFNNLLRLTEQFVQGKNFSPATSAELMAKLHLHSEHKKTFRDVLKELTKKGALQLRQGRYHAEGSQCDVVKGTIKMHRRGFGFVTPENTQLCSQDIFIPKHLTQNAVDGDVVEVEINPQAFSEKGPEGKVVAILKRSRTHLAGIITFWGGENGGEAYVPMLGLEKRVIVETSDMLALEVGDRVVFEVLEWGKKESPTRCRATHLLGHISQAECDIAAAVEAFELRNEFPADVIEEAKKIGTRVTPKDIKGRKDLRHLECVTIDPDTAKDFDDALSLTKDKQGNYLLGVHIADVSHYVTPGSRIDAEAVERCNSTYFPGSCIPMLPPGLSENLCSLKPNVNRLAASVMMRFDKEGELLGYEMIRSVIKSQKRFTYKEAKLVLDGKKKSKHAELLERFVSLCALLKKKRYERGSIEFSLPELAILVDAAGVPTGTDYIPYDITHQLVEEFMLKANETVATHLSGRSEEVAYRVHEPPAGENMKEFASLAHSFGFQLPEEPSPQDLQKLFDEALKTSYGTFLATSYIRCMRLAVYSRENIGHYGLGLSHYCHFTSPIRRYVDLVVHRVLFGDKMSPEELERIADQCSEQERLSEKAENSVRQLKKLRLLRQMMEKERNKQFEAVVTRVRNFGVYFEVLDLMVEGFLHVSELHDDYYEFDSKKGILYGVHQGGHFFVGDKILVMPKKVDLILQETEWHLVHQRAFSKKEKTSKSGMYKQKRKRKK